MLGTKHEVSDPFSQSIEASLMKRLTFESIEIGSVRNDSGSLVLALRIINPEITSDVDLSVQSKQIAQLLYVTYIEKHTEDISEILITFENWDDGLFGLDMFWRSGNSQPFSYSIIKGKLINTTGRRL